MTQRYIRKVADTGNGSGRVVLPKDYLRDIDLVDEDGELVDGHVSLTWRGDQLVVEGVGPTTPTEAVE